MRKEDWLTIKEAADFLGIKQDALRKRIRRGTYRYRHVRGKGKQKEIRIFKWDILREAEEKEAQLERERKEKERLARGTKDTRGKKAKPKVLLADDSEDFTRYLSKYLTDWEVLIARDGEEALRLLENEFPDLLLLEIPIPKINGYEVIKRKNQNGLIARIPFAFVSYLKGSLKVEEGKTYKPQGYFRKPLLADELEEFRSFVARMREEVLSANKEGENI